MSKILLLTLFTPFIGGCILLFIPKEDKYFIRDISLVTSLTTFLGGFFI